jgi:hypothetical protein
MYISNRIEIGPKIPAKEIPAENCCRKLLPKIVAENFVAENCCRKLLPKIVAENCCRN